MFSVSPLTSSGLSPSRYYLCSRINPRVQQLHPSTSSRLVTSNSNNFGTILSPYLHEIPVGYSPTFSHNISPPSSPLLSSFTPLKTRPQAIQSHYGPFLINYPTLSHSPHTIPTHSTLHNMVTRSQTGNLKPRVLPSLLSHNTSNRHVISIPSEPTSFKEANKDPN